MRLVLFDIDGTLILSGGAGLKALRRVFQELYGLENATDGIEFHGRTDPRILRSIAREGLGRELEPAELERVVSHYLGVLDEALPATDAYRVLPGARETVADLAARTDVALGLATGNLEPAAYAKLRRGGLDGFFRFGGFGSDSEDRDELTRLAVARGRALGAAEAGAVLIGDTVRDVRSALAAGVDCLAVATGNASEAVLEAAGARWTVPTLEAPLVREVLGLPVTPRPTGGVG
jgi:phosphoglycolate phosphatase-like HAD superfamily hydrolase